MTDERRGFQRLNLTQPLDGWLGDYSVRLLDVSAIGAQIEHDEPIPADSRAILRFWWRDEEVEITAEIARSDDSRSGLRFVEENDALRRLLAQSATELLRAQEANAAGIREANFIADETLTASSAGVRISGFVTMTLVDGKWKRRPSLLPDQPANGFTIAAGEADEQIELLCRTYQDGDAEARRLTRLLAELSVAAVR